MTNMPRLTGVAMVALAGKCFLRCRRRGGLSAFELGKQAQCVRPANALKLGGREAALFETLEVPRSRTERIVGSKYDLLRSGDQLQALHLQDRKSVV